MNSRMHYLHAVFWAGFSGVFFIVPTLIFKPSLLHFSKYTFKDFIFLTMSALGDTFG